MSATDKPVLRSDADGQIIPNQFYDADTGNMESVASDNPLPVDIPDGEKIGIDGVVVIGAGSAIIGKIGIDQTTDGATNKVQSRNATHDNFNANTNIQVGDVDVSNTNPVPFTEVKISTAISATPVTVDTTSGGTVIATSKSNRLSITLQNTSTVPCIIRLGGNPSTTLYNFILAGDSATRAGNGGSVTITGWTGEIKGLTEATSTVIATMEVVS